MPTASSGHPAAIPRTRAALLIALVALAVALGMVAAGGGVSAGRSLAALLAVAAAAGLAAAVVLERGVLGPLRRAAAAHPGEGGEVHRLVARIDRLAADGAEAHARLARLVAAERDLADRLGALSRAVADLAGEGEGEGEGEGAGDDGDDAVGRLAARQAALAALAAQIGRAAEVFGAASEDLARRTDTQAATLEQTAAALGQLTASVQASAHGAAEVDGVVGKAREEAGQSAEVVNDAVAAMAGIERSSHEIGQIIGVIDDIAFQTNLLALNAGVEAARAGEAGRGFAVVASEVRTLAQRSSDAARQIKDLVGDSARQVRSGVELVGRAGVALTAITGRVTQIAELVSDIAHGSAEQATALGEISNGVTDLDRATQQNAAMAAEAAAAAQALRTDAQRLADLASGRSAARPPAAAPSLAPSVPPLSVVRREATTGQPVADGAWEEF